MATLPVSSLVPFLRVMADDNNISLQEFTDKQLSDEYLRLGVMMQEASWNNGYLVRLNTDDPNNQFYEIVGDNEVPQWLQILYVLKTALGMKIFQEIYSFDNKVIKVTNTSKKEDLQGLQFLYDEILQERKYSTCGFVYTTFDDFRTRYNLILNETSKGFI
jgi:hypothetical protein